MSEDQAPTPRPSKAAKPVRETTQFIFIGDPNDNGKGSRAPRDDDEEDNGVPMTAMYGFKFPLGKPVAVPLDAKIGTSSMMICEKLRGNSHFFEGTEAELSAAKAAGEIVIKKAKPKAPVLVRFHGMRRKDLPSENVNAMDD